MKTVLQIIHSYTVVLFFFSLAFFPLFFLITLDDSTYINDKIYNNIRGIRV